MLSHRSFQDFHLKPLGHVRKNCVGWTRTNIKGVSRHYPFPRPEALPLSYHASNYSADDFALVCQSARMTLYNDEHIHSTNAAPSFRCAKGQWYGTPFRDGANGQNRTVNLCFTRALHYRCATLAGTAAYGKKTKAYAATGKEVSPYGVVGFERLELSTNCL